MEFRQFEAHDEEGRGRRRFLWVLVGILAAFLVLAVRLWQLQILQGETFDRLSDKNRIRLRRIPSTRGIVFDRNGKILADNRPSFNLMAVPAEITDPNATLQSLYRGVELDPMETMRAVTEAKRLRPFKSLVIAQNLSWNEVAWVETHKLDLPGIWVEAAPLRFYPYGSATAHLLGYMGEITETLLERWRSRGYRLGDRIGMSGIERHLETFFRGRDGGIQVEVDAQGRELMVLQEISFEPGANATLTIDVFLQQVAEEALGDRAGAVVAGDPVTGAILAMVSHPDFDPNRFSEGITSEAWQKLVRDPRHPLQNRVLAAQYPPGSTFKIVTAIAGLEEGVITPDTRLFCPGHYNLGDREYACWKEQGHGWLRLKDALIQSCDVFFYQVGQMLGVDRLAKYAVSLGLGERTGLDPNNEKAGLVPTRSWKKRRFSERWHQGETLSVAIGQGYSLVTPIQQFVLVSAVANGGRLVVPFVINKIQRPDGKILTSSRPHIRGRTIAGDKTLHFIREAMEGSVNHPRGTGKRAMIPGVRVAGKTGTAQVVRLERIKKGEPVPYAFRDHAWFVGFAPAEAPRIAVVVLVEHGGHGGAAAAPIAKRILEAFFRKPKDMVRHGISQGTEIAEGGLDDHRDHPSVGSGGHRKPL